MHVRSGRGANYSLLKVAVVQRRTALPKFQMWENWRNVVVGRNDAFRDALGGAV